jgi:glycosyltransferase involved in cell wall biosynthesis
MVDATAIIMTKDEELNIVECLQSIKNFAKRMVVIDCSSTDRTVELARENGAYIYIHEFEYYAKQFNWGINNTDIDTEWIIRLDADERFTPELCKELETLISAHQGDDMNGIAIEADLFFLGRCMKHGPRNKRKMMMFKKAVGRIEDRRRDAHSNISKGYSISTEHKFLHYDYKSLSEYIDRYNQYATREMQDYNDYIKGIYSVIKTDSSIQKQRKKKFGFYYKVPKFVRAWMWFLYNYLFRAGFLDGKEGLVFCFLECYWYRFLVDAKLFENEKKSGKF